MRAILTSTLYAPVAHADSGRQCLLCLVSTHRCGQNMFPGVVRHCRSPGVLAFLCLAASALLVLGVTSPVEEAWNSCQEECRESASCFESTATGSRACIGDSRKCRERYQCSRHDSCPKCALLWEEEQKAHESLATCKSRCRTSPGPDLPMRGRQLSLSLSFLAVVSCLHFEGAQKGGREGREGRKVGCCGGGCGCGDSGGLAVARKLRPGPEHAIFAGLPVSTTPKV